MTTRVPRDAPIGGILVLDLLLIGLIMSRMVALSNPVVSQSGRRGGFGGPWVPV